ITFAVVRSADAAMSPLNAQTRSMLSVPPDGVPVDGSLLEGTLVAERSVATSTAVTNPAHRPSGMTSRMPLHPLPITGSAPSCGTSAKSAYGQTGATPSGCAGGNGSTGGTAPMFAVALNVTTAAPIAAAMMRLLLRIGGDYPRPRSRGQARLAPIARIASSGYGAATQSVRRSTPSVTSGSGSPPSG